LGTSVRYLKDADLLIFEQIVKGMAGKTLPKPRVALMAHLYWAIFPTTLKPEDAGFGKLKDFGTGSHVSSRLR